MQTVLSGAAVGASLLGLVYTVLLTRDRPRVAPSPALTSATWLAAGTILLFFVLTLPVLPPFSPGIPTLGLGCLVGGALGLFALRYLPGVWDDDEGTARAVGILAAAALGPGFLLVVFSGYPNEALMGCALGASAVAIAACARIRPASDGDEGALAACRSAEMHAILSAIIVAGARLAIERFPRSDVDSLAGGYWAVPALAPAVAALALMIVAGGWSARMGDRRWWVHAFVGAAIALATCLLLRIRLVEMPWLAPTAGAVGALLVLAMPVGGYRERPLSLAIGAALIGFGLCGLAFRDAQGYGLALAALIAAIAVAVPYLGRPAGEPRVSDALGIGFVGLVALIALQRILIERAGRTIILDYQEFYSLTATFLGAAAGFAVMAYAARPATVPRAILAGAIAAAAPLAIAALWATRATAAFTGGLALSCVVWMVMSAGVLRDGRRIVAAAAPLPLALGSALVAAQLGPNVLDMDVTRGTRIAIVGVLTLIILAWIVLDGVATPDGVAAADETAAPDRAEE